jgi:hypothetical protein
MSATRFSDSRVGSDEVAQFARSHPAIVKLGRLGWVAKGLVYGLVGILALLVAIDRGAGQSTNAGEASQSGAIARMADRSYGPGLLWLVAIGLFLYALWRVVTVLLPADADAKTTVARIGYAISAVVYVTLALSALSYARHTASTTDPSKSEDSRVERWTRELMGHTAGRWVLGLIGLVVIGAGVYFLAKACRRPYDDQLSGRSLGPLAYDHIVVMGRVGWTGRAVMMWLIGFFLLRAAWTFDSTEAQGLDGSLHKVIDTNWGMVLAVVVGAGLLLYGAYCVVSAPQKRLAAADQ